MKRYVLGFCFNTDGTEVVMIRKLKPEWQAGFLNGVGGKIEKSDEHSSITTVGQVAMSREFEEETGCAVEPTEWDYFCRMHNEHFEVLCYCLFADVIAYAAKTVEAEEVCLIESRYVGDRDDCISNIPWLIALAMDRVQGSNGDNNHTKMFADVQYELPGA